MEVGQTVPPLPENQRLVDYILCELKSQGIFDQFRKECIADVDTKPAYQNLHQRVEVTVDGFLAKQTWKPDLNKNQIREKLRKHILDTNILEQGVGRIVDQVVNPKIPTVFLPQVEELVYKYLGLEKPDKKVSGNVGNSSQLESDTLLPNDLEAVSPDSVKSHEKSADNSFTETENTDIEMKLVENKEEVEVKVDKSIPSVESYDDSDDSKDDDFESPAFEPLDDLKRGSPNVSQHSANSDINSRDSSDWRASAKSNIKSQESSDSADEKLFSKTAITYDSGEDANMTSPVKANVQGTFKLTNEDNSSDARQCFESAMKTKRDEKMDYDSDDTFVKSEQRQDPIKSLSNTGIEESIRLQRSSIESKTSSESNKPMPNMDVSMDSNESKDSSIFTPTQKDSFNIVKDTTYTFTNKIQSVSDKSMDDTSNSNELKIDLQESAESEDNTKNISRLSISGSEDLKSPSDIAMNFKESSKKDDPSHRHKSSKDFERHSSSSSHHRDRRDDSKHHSKSSHSKHSSRYDDRRHSSSHDRKSESHRSSSSKDDIKKDKYQKSNNGDRDKESKDRHGSSSHKSSSSSHKSSSYKSSSSYRHDDKHRHSTSEKGSDRPSLNRHESKDSHKSDKNKDLPHSSRESSLDKTSSRHGEKSSHHSSHDKNRHSHSSSSHRERSSSSKHASSSDKQKSSGDKKHDDKKSKDKREKSGERCSTYKIGRTRRSTDRDSNDGNDSSNKPPASSTNTGTSNKTSTKEKSSHHSKGGHSNGSSSSSQSDEIVTVEDKVKVSAGGYIKSEFNMFQPVVKKPSQIHRSPENVPMPVTPVSTKKPVIHIDSQLNPSKEVVQDIPSTPKCEEKLIKPRIASNIFEARKFMKVRKNIDLLEKRQLQNAQKELEKSKNTPKNESKIYSGISGPELRIVCRKMSFPNPKSPKCSSLDDVETDALLYFDEESKSKSSAALERSKKHLRRLQATHNGISHKVESAIFLLNSDKGIQNALVLLSSKHHIIKTVNIRQGDVCNKILDTSTTSKSTLHPFAPSSSSLGYTDSASFHNDLIKSKCLPLKKRKMSDGKLNKNMDIPNIIPSKVEERAVVHYNPYYDIERNQDDEEYLDYYSKVDDMLCKASTQDIMEIILGSGIKFDSSLVDLNHIKKIQSFEDNPSKIETTEEFSHTEKVSQSKKRRISFKGTDDIIEPGVTYNNNLKEQNECSPAKRRNIPSNEKNGDGDTNSEMIKNGLSHINSVLTNNTWGKARRVGLSKEIKPLKGIIRNKFLIAKDSPQSPDSDKSVENHPNHDDESFKRKLSAFKEKNMTIALSRINNQPQSVRNKISKRI